MLIAERRQRLLEHVRIHGYVSYRDLALALDTSESTVRRDLRSMVDEGLLTATRGGVGPAPAAGWNAAGANAAGANAAGANAAGANAAGSGAAGSGAVGSGAVGSNAAGWSAVGSTAAAPEPGPGSASETVAGRPAQIGSNPTTVPALGGGDGSDAVRAEREAIAASAAQLIVPGSAVLLGPGRTTTALARRLGAISHLTVVTNSMTVTAALADATQIDVVVVGGALRRSIGAVVGPITEQTVRGLRGAQVFLSGEGVTVERGLTTPNVFAAATDQALMSAGSQVVVLADHTKIGRETMCQTVPTGRIDVLVTDAKADPAILRRLRAEGVDVRIS